MRARHRFILLLIPPALMACDADRASSPTPPTSVSLTNNTCELGVSNAQARSGIAALVEDIRRLETEGTLTSGQANALRGHLDNVLRHIDAGRYCPALAQLAAFREQVGNFEAEGILTPDDAAGLTGGATLVIVGPPNLVTVNPPSGAAGRYSAGWAEFGPQPTIGGVTAAIVLVSDGQGTREDGCEPLVGFPAGAIALVERGLCSFIVKAQNAQNAGAVAMIVFDHTVRDLPVNMTGTWLDIGIPSVSVTRTSGLTIAAGLPATGTVSRKP